MSERTSMKHMVAFVIAALSWKAMAHAAEPLPPRLTGVWTTGESPYEGGVKRIDLYVEADGAGALVGTVSARPMGNTDDGTPGPRSSISMLTMATLDGELLTVRTDATDRRYAGPAQRMTLRCGYDAAGPALTCADPNGVTLGLQRHSDTITPDSAQLLAAMRAAMPANEVGAAPASR